METVMEWKFHCSLIGLDDHFSNTATLVLGLSMCTPMSYSALVNIIARMVLFTLSRNGFSKGN
jgi:hypothetical protein